LWRLIEIKGGLVTLDALNPQNEIARADSGARGRVDPTTSVSIT
jgi:hypothetical protein